MVPLIDEEIEKIAKIGSSLTVISIEMATVLNSIIQILMSQSLAQIWGMINGLQMLLFLPSFNVEVPGLAMVII